MYEHLALSDNGFLFDTRTGNTFSLSHSGTFLLRALIAGADPDTLVDRLTEHFEVDPAVARRDIDQFIFRLRDLGLTAEPNGDHESNARAEPGEDEPSGDGAEVDR